MTEESIVKKSDEGAINHIARPGRGKPLREPGQRVRAIFFDGEKPAGHEEEKLHVEKVDESAGVEVRVAEHDHEDCESPDDVEIF